MANHYYVKCFSCHKKELNYLPRIGIANETLITINPVTIIRHAYAVYPSFAMLAGMQLDLHSAQGRSNECSNTRQGIERSGS